MILFHWSVQNSVTFCENVEIQQKQAKSTARLKILHPPTVNDRNNSFVCSCFHKIIQIFLGGLMRNHIVTALFKWLNCFIWNGCIWYWFSTNALIQIVLKPWFKSVLTGRNLLPSLIDVACILLVKQQTDLCHIQSISWVFHFGVTSSQSGSYLFDDCQLLTRWLAFIRQNCNNFGTDVCCEPKSVKPSSSWP